MEQHMESWLRCTLFPGQFSSELAVVVKSVHGREFSLFAAKTDLEYDENPTENHPVEGWVRVNVVQRERNLYLVRLPQTTLENGQYVTVAAGQLRAVPDKQEGCSTAL
jgi:hypothetical protein